MYDFDGDGLADLLVGEKSDADTGKVRYFRNTGTAVAPVFTNAGYLSCAGEDIAFPASGCQGLHVSFGDVDGDRRDDMVIGLSDGTTYVWRFRRGGPGAEKAPVRWPAQPVAGFASARAVTVCRDLDGDGRDEIVMGGLDGKFRVYRYAADGSVGETTFLCGTDGEPLSVAAGRSTPVFVDVNADGRDDLVTGDSAGDVWAFISVAGGFASSPVRLSANEGGSNRSRLAVGDVDGDGCTDILVGKADGAVTVLKPSSSCSPGVSFTVLKRLGVEDALGGDLFWAGTSGWYAVQSGNEASARVTVSSSEKSVVLTTKVKGMGLVSFNWAALGNGATSAFVCMVDEVEALSRTGAFARETGSVTLASAGDHVIKWVFRGPNTAVLDSVAFTPADPESQFTQTTDVPVPFEEIRRIARNIWHAHGGDYEAAGNAVGANGHTVWESYLAGLDPEDPDSKLRAVVKIVDGEPVIGWNPDLSTSDRVYTTYGKSDLNDETWSVVTDDNKATFRFFKVEVRMK